MRLAFKYRARISKTTESNALTWLTLCRNLYNAALEQRISMYRQHRKSISMYEQKRQLVGLKQECPEYWFVDAQVLQQVVITLDKAFKNFFRRIKQGDTPGFPRFKPESRYNSFILTNSSWKFDGKRLAIRNVGVFKLFDTDKYPVRGRIKTVTVRRDSTGKWWVSFSCDDVQPRAYPDATGEIGIDVGLREFLKDSNGNTVDNPRYYRKAEKKLRRVQRALSRKQKGSKRRIKEKKRVARVHEKVRNQRQYFLHKITKEIVKNNQVITVEKLNITNMLTTRELSKSIMDAAWGEFFRILAYKAEEAGREYVAIDPKYTTQECSGCGALVPKKLSTRIHKCPYCGLVMGRTYNSACNIKKRGGQSRHTITPSTDGVV